VHFISSPTTMRRQKLKWQERMQQRQTRLNKLLNNRPLLRGLIQRSARSAYELAEEQLELAKLSAASSKFTTDAEKSKAEADLIVASRNLEIASARLVEAERSELITARRTQNGP
jgi:hypothetical protein